MIRVAILSILVLLYAVTLSPAAYAEEKLAIFEAELIFKEPNPKLWTKDAEQRQPDKGMMFFKHKGITDKKGNLIQPVLGIVYEKLPPGVTNPEQYATIARKRSQFKVESVVRRKDINSIIYFCLYDNGMLHNLVIAHFVFNGNGVQVTGDSTSGVYEHVEKDIRSFIESIRFSAESVSRPAGRVDRSETRRDQRNRRITKGDSTYDRISAG